MASTIIMPQLGETVAEGKILTWFKSVGDEVKEGDNLFEVETDKVTIEVQAVIAGRLSAIHVAAGATAKIGEVVAVVGGGESVEPPIRAKPVRKAGPPVRVEPPVRIDAPAGKAALSRSPFEEVSTPTDRFGPSKGPNGVRVTPLARRLIAQHGVDLAELAAEAGERPENKINEAAVRRAIAAHSATAKVSAASVAPLPKPPSLPVRAGDLITLNTVRQRTGERLAENWRTIPHVFQAIEVDFSAVDGVRKKHKETFKNNLGFSLTYLPYIARATCLALACFPKINARFDGKALTLSPNINLGIAVDLDHNGLVVPVVHNAGDLTVIGLAKAIRRQVGKARAGKLAPDDLAGGSYSISNNGAFGTSFTTPIINAPQVGILSTDAIRLRAAVVSTPEDNFVAPRMIGMIGQSFDHRAFDGAYSGAFLSRLKQILETRDWAEEFSSDF